MELYFAPMACSLATRIALYEAGAVRRRSPLVDPQGKANLGDGADFLAVNPMGQVPVLRTETDDLLTENPVVLQYVADHCPGFGPRPEPRPQGALPPATVAELRHFESHKVVFIPLLGRKVRWRQGVRARPGGAAVHVPQR